MGNGGADVGSNQSPEKVIRARAVSRASILAFQTSTMQMHARLMFFDDSQNRTPRYRARNTSGLYQVDPTRPVAKFLHKWSYKSQKARATRNAKMPATLFEVVHFKHPITRLCCNAKESTCARESIDI